MRSKSAKVVQQLAGRRSWSELLAQVVVATLAVGWVLAQTCEEANFELVGTAPIEVEELAAPAIGLERGLERPCPAVLAPARQHPPEPRTHLSNDSGSYG